MPESILKASCTSARHAGSFDCLMASLILITMDNGRGHCAWWQSCTVPNQTHKENNKKRKMYAIKQIKICAEYRDMLPKPRLDLSGTPGLRPIGLSPGSWQTSLGLGSMSRYSAQILIVRRAGLLWSQQDFEWRWSVPLFKCLTVLEFSFILFDLCLLITFFNFIMNYVPIVTFWIFTYHKIGILSIMFCFIWSYWLIYFLACLEVSWRVVS